MSSAGSCLTGCVAFAASNLPTTRSRSGERNRERAKSIRASIFLRRSAISDSTSSPSRDSLAENRHSIDHIRLAAALLSKAIPLQNAVVLAVPFDRDIGILRHLNAPAA